jgi:DNA-binding NarL/FixJ family response regulator
MRRRQANPDPELLYFPSYIFRDRSVAVLEAIVVYAKEKGFTYREIARLLNRDERTIWTTYHRVQKKR